MTKLAKEHTAGEKINGVDDDVSIADSVFSKDESPFNALSKRSYEIYGVKYDDEQDGYETWFLMNRRGRLCIKKGKYLHEYDYLIEETGGKIKTCLDEAKARCTEAGGWMAKTKRTRLLGDASSLANPETVRQTGEANVDPISQPEMRSHGVVSGRGSVTRVDSGSQCEIRSHRVAPRRSYPFETHGPIPFYAESDWCMLYAGFNLCRLEKCQANKVLKAVNHNPRCGFREFTEKACPIMQIQLKKVFNPLYDVKWLLEQRQGKYIAEFGVHAVGIDCDNRFLYDCGQKDVFPLTKEAFAYCNLTEVTDLRIVMPRFKQKK